jgi:hypothetical protein
VVRFRAGAREFSSDRPDRLWGRPLHSVRRALSARIKQPGLEADHSLVSCAEVKNEWMHHFNANMPMAYRGTSFTSVPNLGIVCS